MKYLFIVSLGPVQDFIAAARRSRDLWFGSWLLSELSKAAARSLKDQQGELIFPVPQREEDLIPGSDFNVANKITAIIDGDPARIASEVEVRVRDRLRDVMEEAFKSIKKEFYEEQARAQVEDMLEFFAVAVPFNDNYAKALDEANRLLAARKNTREFSAVCWGAEVPKSSLDGQRESVIPEEVYDTLSQDKLREVYGVAPAERLCGVGLLKRHGGKDIQEGFLSTPHLAALSLMRAMKLEHKDAAEEYISRLRELGATGEDLNTVKVRHEVLDRYDGHILFEERLHEFISEEKLEQAKKALRRFLESTVKKRPIPYYAILQADGDHMGKLLDKELDRSSHQKISQKLSQFAEKAGGIVNRHKGSLVYSGGDDVLAMLPLHTVLDCADELAQEFSECLKGFKTQPTLSLGIAVAHHIDPMYDALELARRAEKAAKSVKDKDALSVIVSKRSGSDTEVKGKRRELISRLKTLSRFHAQDEIPDGFAYELRMLSEQFKEYETSKQIIEKEALRILERKRRKRGSKELAEEVKNRLKEYLRPGNADIADIADIAEELIVARLFAEAYLLAYGKEAANVLGD